MGGGRRLCELAGCKKIAESGGTQHCKAHGGGRRCQHEGCPKQAVTGGLPTCIAHGGGKRCQHEGCFKTVAQFPGSVYCTLCLRRGVAAPSPPVSHAVLPPQPSPAHARSPAHRAPPTAAATVSDEEPEDDNDDECTLCGARGGFLISCSFCARSFHFDCLDTETLESLSKSPDDASWACPRKACKVPSLLTISVRLGVRASLSCLRCGRWCPDRRPWAQF
jgi:hypothetical protein